VATLSARVLRSRTLDGMEAVTGDVLPVYPDLRRGPSQRIVCNRLDAGGRPISGQVEPSQGDTQSSGFAGLSPAVYSNILTGDGGPAGTVLFQGRTASVHSFVVLWLGRATNDRPAGHLLSGT
jgi:hypothetical protein